MLGFLKFFLRSVIEDIVEMVLEFTTEQLEELDGKMIQLSGPIFGRVPILIFTISPKPPAGFRRSRKIKRFKIGPFRFTIWLNTVPKWRFRKLERMGRVIDL